MRTNKTGRIAHIAVVLLLFAATAVYGQSPQDNNALEITIYSFKGTLEIKNKGEKEWKPYDATYYELNDTTNVYSNPRSITVSEGTEIKVSDGYRMAYRSITDVDKELNQRFTIYLWLKENDDVNTLLKPNSSHTLTKADEKTFKKIKQFLSNGEILKLLYENNRYCKDSKDLCNRYVLDQWLSIDDEAEEKLFKDKFKGEYKCETEKPHGPDMKEVLVELKKLIPKKYDLLCEMRTVYSRLKTVLTEQRIRGDAFINLGDGRILTLYNNTHLVIDKACYEKGTLNISLFLERGRITSTLGTSFMDTEPEKRYDTIFKITTDNANVEYTRSKDLKDITIASFGVDYDPVFNRTYVISEEGCVSLRCRWYWGADPIKVCRNEEAHLDGCSEPGDVRTVDSNVMDKFYGNEPMSAQKSVFGQ